MHKTYSIYFKTLYKYKKAITITCRTPRNRFVRNLLKNSNSKTKYFGFLGTETMESSTKVPEEFDTNLELLKIAYNV
jgi:hypothetical protein